MAGSTPDQQVVQGRDVQVTMTGPSGPVLTGQFQECVFTIRHTPEPYMESNEQISRQLTGDIEITNGRLRRGWQNLDIINRLMGQDPIQRGSRIIPPRFTLTMTVAAPEKGLNGTISVTNAVFTDLTLTMQAGRGVVRNDVTFVAEGVA